MLATIISYSVALAVAALVLSLPFGRTQPGRALRRIAAFFALIAILPALVASLFSPQETPAADGCGVVGTIGLIVASLTAWLILRIRSTSATASGSKRTPLKRPYQHRADHDLISMIRDRIQDERDDA